MVGTVFTTTWDPEARTFAVDMDEGEVRVRGPVVGEDRQVRDTDVLKVGLEEERSSLNGGLGEPARVEVSAEEEAAPVEVPTTVTPVAPAGVSESPEITEAQPIAPAWVTLAKAGRYADAVREVRVAGVQESLEGADAPGLALLGDAARLDADLDLATEAYTQLRSRHPGSSESTLAAVSLGRMAFDQQQDLEQAARWLRVALEEDPDGPLAREALGRLMEAERTLGHRSLARELASDYLRRFPDGPHASTAAQLAGRNRR